MASKSSSTAARQRSRPAEASSPDVSASDLQSDADPFASDDSNQASSTRRGRPNSGKGQTQRRGGKRNASDVDEDEEEIEDEGRREDDNMSDDEDEMQKSIPAELLTRLLHEFFEKEGSRISRDANDAVAKYMDVFVRETIARAAVEKESGFLEVEDLEKVAPQVLLDL